MSSIFLIVSSVNSPPRSSFPSPGGGAGLEVLEVTVVLVGISAPESGLVGWSGFSTPSP